MSGWQTFGELCSATDIEADVKSLSPEDLRELRTTLARINPTEGIPAVIASVATIEAADRWQALGGDK